MNDLLNLIKDLNVPPEKLQELADTAQENPLAAMAMVNQLGISPEVIQKLMSSFMANPGMIFELAKQFGVDTSSLAGQIPGMPELPKE